MKEILDTPEKEAVQRKESETESLGSTSPVKRLVDLVKGNRLISGDRKHILLQTISLKFNKK